MAICRFSVATDESYQDRDGQRQEKTEWHRVVTFQKQAENCSNYLHKGSLVFCGRQPFHQQMDRSAGPNPLYNRNQSPAGAVSGAQGRPPGAGSPPRTATAASKTSPMTMQMTFGPAFPSEASGMDDVPF
jgi:single stranded DNA-binding protein (ssb)